MKRATFTTLALLLTSTLLTTVPAAGYHWDDENENSAYMSAAGDEAVIRDGGECFNQTAGIEDAHCVVLYGHVFDLRNTVPMNVQSPATCAPDLARGFTGDPVHTGQRNHMELFSSPGFVEYTEENCGGVGQEPPRIHPERALSSDIRIEKEVPIYGYWYLSADHGEFSPFGLNSPEETSTGVLPCVSVRMQLWTQRYPGSGTLLAEGTTTKTVLSTPGAAGEPDAVEGLVDEICPGSTGTVDPHKVTEFEVAMEKQEETLIPDHEAYVISIDWYQHDSGDPDQEPNLMQRDWNLHTGSEYPNRVVMAVKDSIRIDELRLVEFNDQLWIRGSINTPWGSYDVDTENILLTLHDEEGKEVPLDHLSEPDLDYDTDHGGHYKPVNATYTWDYESEGLEPGEYTFRLKVTNWQHTKDIEAEETFTLQDDGVDVKKKVEVPEEKPTPLPATIIAALLLIVPLLRALGRRRDA